MTDRERGCARCLGYFRKEAGAGDGEGGRVECFREAPAGGGGGLVFPEPAETGSGGRLGCFRKGAEMAEGRRRRPCWELLLCECEMR